MEPQTTGHNERQLHSVAALRPGAMALPCGLQLSELGVIPTGQIQRSPQVPAVMHRAAACFAWTGSISHPITPELAAAWKRNGDAEKDRGRSFSAAMIVAAQE